MSSEIFSISNEFKDKIRRCFKAEGEAWLQKLPALLEELVRKWDLTNCQAEENLSVHYICYATSPEFGEVVLKTGVPHLELFSGMEALERYAGRQACALYKADRELGAMLMERLGPGIRLRDEPDMDVRLSTGTALVRTLPMHISGAHGFPDFEAQMHKAFERVRRERQDTREFLDMLAIADVLYDEIKTLGRPKLLLHGDLHHENILKDHTGRWKIIDPQGRIGEQCLETGRFLMNEWGWLGGIGDLNRMARCVDAFAAALGETRRTIAASTFLDYALSNSWSLEDGCPPEEIEEAVTAMKCLLELMK